MLRIQLGDLLALISSVVCLVDWFGVQAQGLATCSYMLRERKPTSSRKAFRAGKPFVRGAVGFECHR